MTNERCCPCNGTNDLSKQCRCVRDGRLCSGCFPSLHNNFSTIDNHAVIAKNPAFPTASSSHDTRNCANLDISSLRHPSVPQQDLTSEFVTHCILGKVSTHRTSTGSRLVNFSLLEYRQLLRAFYQLSCGFLNEKLETLTSCLLASCRPRNRCGRLVGHPKDPNLLRLKQILLRMLSKSKSDCVINDSYFNLRRMYSKLLKAHITAKRQKIKSNRLKVTERQPWVLGKELRNKLCSRLPLRGVYYCLFIPM
ncbi:hypothetical protein GJ496_002009 [Pomphorhynchus laevis]|nr:hypothetical protein GJ496_002009 [Pomphorhynchus laevis]